MSKRYLQLTESELIGVVRKVLKEEIGGIVVDDGREYYSHTGRLKNPKGSVSAQLAHVKEKEWGDTKIWLKRNLRSFIKRTIKQKEDKIVFDNEFKTKHLDFRFFALNEFDQPVFCVSAGSTKVVYPLDYLGTQKKDDLSLHVRSFFDSIVASYSSHVVGIERMTEREYALVNNLKNPYRYSDTKLQMTEEEREEEERKAPERLKDLEARMRAYQEKMYGSGY